MSGLLSWRIGDVTVTRVVEMHTDAPHDGPVPFILEADPDALKAMPWLYPHYVTPDGLMKISIHALFVDAPGVRLVVDTCMGNDKPRYLLGGNALHTAFLDDIAAAGFPRESIGAVVCTHLHVDHVGWNTMLVGGRWVPTFPNARYLVARREYEHWMETQAGEHVAIMADSVKPVFDAGLAELVELDHRLSPELSLVPTTGHTPGHVSVLIESKGERALITGDMMHHPCQIGRPHWSSEFDGDKAAAAVTRKARVEEWADTPLLIIGTHFAAPTAGYIRRDGEHYRLEA